MKLRCLGIKDLPSAIVVADSLLFYKLGNPSTSEGKDKKWYKKGSEIKSEWKNGKDNSSRFKPKTDDSQSKVG